ncbi:MAG: lipopolysaccharide biosynthesis protein [Chloroflexi bacterium]|nr:lipopolysaccharide biosynthesis protein [Chloroflexota bacterium]
MSFRREVGLGLFWVTVSAIALKGVSMVRDMVLARWLLPDELGLVATATMAVSAVELFAELGFSSALIYRKDNTDTAANTAFVLVIVNCLVLYGIAWVVAPYVAHFFAYRVQGATELLTRVLRVLALTMVMASFGEVPLTLLTKSLGFKKRVLPEMIAGLSGTALSIALAFMQKGVWSIVAGRVLTSMLMSILVWFFCDWRPKFTLSKQVAKELWEYGRHIIGSQVLVFGITNIDNAMVARYLGPASLGGYWLAYKLSNLPATEIGRVVGRVMFPTYSRVQGDLARLRQVFLKSAKFVALIAFPVATITMVFAPDFMDVAYGGKYPFAVPALQWLTIYGLARAIAGTMGSVFKAGGKPKWLVYIATWRLATMAILLYPAMRWKDLTGVGILSAVVAVIDFAISLTLTNRIIQARWISYARTFVPMAIVATATALVAHPFYLWLVRYVHPFVTMPLSGALALGIYLGIMYAYDPEVRQVFGQLVGGLISELRRRFRAPAVSQ